MRRRVRYCWVSAVPNFRAIIRSKTAFGLAVLLSIPLAAPAAAQWPPKNTVHIIVPFAAGGIGDVLMRVLAQEVSQKTNGTILVETRPGGGGVIGTDAVARSSPDGTTLLLVGSSFIINANLQSLPYDPLTSFVPICLLARTPLVFVVNRKSGYQSLSQFIAAARDPDRQISVGGTGPNTTQHLAIESLKQASNTHLQFVPFGGDPPAVNSLLGGHITAVLGQYAGVKAYLGAALRPLAVGGHDRLPELPDVPTFTEAELAEFDAVAWIGLVLPRNTPEHIATQIATYFRAALDAPEVKTKLEALALAPVGLCGTDFGAFLHKEQERTVRIVRAAKMKVD